MEEYDYMMALWSQFCPTWSEDETSEKLYQKLRDVLPKMRVYRMEIDKLQFVGAKRTSNAAYFKE